MSNNKKTTRTHDKIYLKQENQTIKESFKKIANYLEDISNKNIIIGDIGCGGGSFPNYLSNRFERFTVHGYEKDQQLIEYGKIKYPNINFFQMDALNKKSISPESLNVITMSGVLCLFDDYEKVVNNCLSWLVPGGRLIINNMFNDSDVDVFINYKLSDDMPSAPLQYGWNIVSIRSISKVLERAGVSDFKFHDFVIDLDIEKRADDPLRSWTEKNIFGERYITNGLCIHQPRKILVVSKKY